MKTNEKIDAGREREQDYLQPEPVQVEDADLQQVAGGAGCSRTSTYNNICYV